MQSSKTWLRKVGSVGHLFIYMMDILNNLITLYCWPNHLFKITIIQRIGLMFLMSAADMFTFSNTLAEINFHMVATAIDMIW